MIIKIKCNLSIPNISITGTIGKKNWGKEIWVESWFGEEKKETQWATNDTNMIGID